MATEMTATSKESTSHDTVEEKVSSLRAVLDAVRHDSRREAESYLAETKVPHGGE